MSDLPESLQRLHDEIAAHEWLDHDYRVKPGASPEEEALRAQQYLAAQAFHIREALERIAAQLQHQSQR